MNSTKQISANQCVLLAAIAIIFAIAVIFLLTHLQTPSTVVGDYKFTLKDISYYTRGHSRTLAEDMKEANPDREVWIKVQADATDAIRTQHGYSSFSLYGPSLDLHSIIRNPRLTTPDGKSYQPCSNHMETGNLVWDRLTEHSRPSTDFMVYIFQKPIRTDKAIFTADIYSDISPPNSPISSQTWPRIGELRFNNIHIP